MSKRTVRIAAVDVGTHSIHLIIAAFEPGSPRYRVLHREKEIVRLSADDGELAFLSRDAVARGVEVLRKFKRLADSAGAQVRALATSAVREAQNRDEFVHRVEAQTGIRLKIASGPEEARLTYYGVLQALPVLRRRLLLIDIGGGSTEFLVARNRRVAYTNSLKLGAVRLSRRFFKHGSIQNSSVERCREFIEGSLSPALREIGRQNYQLTVGTSGSILNLANMIRFRRGDDGDEKLNGFQFTRQELKRVVDELVSAKTVAHRERIPGLDPRRADVIVGGALILERIMKGAQLDTMTVSGMALREGILADEIQRRSRGAAKAHLDEDRLTSIRSLTRSFHCDEKHARQVTRLSLRLFDDLRRLHRLGSNERELLEAAAMLHEVGLSVSHNGHHRHSYYLIRNSDLLGFAENEKEIIANIARYHRKGLPRPRHDGFGSLTPDEQAVVARLAALLRIADGLDRTHKSMVKDVVCRLARSRLHCTLIRRKGRRLDLEIWGATQKSDLFEEAFGRKVAFEQSERARNTKSPRSTRRAA